MIINRSGYRSSAAQKTRCCTPAPEWTTVEITPGDAVMRRLVSWRGMAGEVVQATRHAKLEVSFRAACHMLVLHEQGVRLEGETLIRGMPKSAHKDLRRKLTFVPGGYEYRDWYTPRTLSRAIHFYFDPVQLPLQAELTFAPRILFEDPVLWQTATKIAALMDSIDADESHYLEANGQVLACELIRLELGNARTEQPVQGGLAAWQKRITVDYIEANVAKEISLTALAQLARLSPHYFCRAFKQTFGIPPLRYHKNRRIETAKRLLAVPSFSVMEIGLNMGYSETSAFTAAFRKATGLTPTAYRHRLT